jgi:hypothetical protein
VYHVQRRAGDTGELDCAIRRLTLELGGPSQSVVLRRSVALGERLLDEHVDRVAVLGVHHHDGAAVGGDLHALEKRLVIDHHGALVRHEELVARHPLVGQTRQVGERPVLLQIRDRNVEADVEHRLLRVDLAVPGIERLTEALARLLHAEVHDRADAAERARDRALVEVVGGDGAAERGIHVGVDVDAGRHDVFSRGVDDAVCLNVERFADERHPLAVDEHVSGVVVGCRDNPAALDQDRHFLLLDSIVGYGATSAEYASGRRSRKNPHSLRWVAPISVSISQCRIASCSAPSWATTSPVGAM